MSDLDAFAEEIGFPDRTSANIQHIRGKSFTIDGPALVTTVEIAGSARSVRMFCDDMLVYDSVIATGGRFSWSGILMFHNTLRLEADANVEADIITHHSRRDPLTQVAFDKLATEAGRR